MDKLKTPQPAPSILVVDDTPANLRLLTGMLKDLGYRVRSVSSGKFALRTAEHDPPDLILLDIMMPVMDGYEVCERLKADEKLAEIPVIFISALGETMDKVKAFQVGGVDYVTKPFQLRELQARVATHIELHRHRRLLQESYEQLEAANKELEAFSSAVSDDLRAPVMRIYGMSRTLLEDCAGCLDEQGRSFIQRVRNEANGMMQFVDDLLKLSRVSRAEVQPQALDLSKFANAIAERVNEQPSDRRIEFVIEPGLSAIGDGHLLEIVMENLLGNAVKFTSKREYARIEFGKTVIDGRTAFYVKDNGVGFDMAHAGKLFAPFQRLHKDSDYPGTGVGLAIVHRIIRRLGGKVWTDAVVDKGATFYFTLASSQQEDRPSGENQHPTVRTQHSSRR